MTRERRVLGTARVRFPFGVRKRLGIRSKCKRIAAGLLVKGQPERAIQTMAAYVHAGIFVSQPQGWGPRGTIVFLGQEMFWKLPDGPIHGPRCSRALQKLPPTSWVTTTLANLEGHDGEASTPADAGVDDTGQAPSRGERDGSAEAQLVRS